MTFKELLGSTLLKGDSTVDTECLEGKVVGLYFSAHWCPPCRRYTPMLIEKYKQLQASGKNFEIVFCHYDRSEASFTEYYGTMPWLALPYDAHMRCLHLSTKYEADTLPSLVLLDESGNLITTNGRSAFAPADVVSTFPWTPPALEDALGDTFVDTNGLTVSLPSLRASNTYIALYFPASSGCTSSDFTAHLAQLYSQLTMTAPDSFEVIVVPSPEEDTGEEEPETPVILRAPWVAVPREDVPRIERLRDHFRVTQTQTPSVVMLDSRLQVVNKAAQDAIAGDLTGDKFPWYPSICMNLEQCKSLHKTPTLIALMDGEAAPGHRERVEAAVTAAAMRVRNAPLDEDLGTAPPDAPAVCTADGKRCSSSGGAGKRGQEMNFCVAKENSSKARQVRRWLEMGEAGAGPEVVLLDFAAGRFYVHCEEADDEEMLARVLTAFRHGTLQMQSLPWVSSPVLIRDAHASRVGNNFAITHMC